MPSRSAIAAAALLLPATLAAACASPGAGGPPAATSPGFDHAHAAWTRVLAGHVRDGRVDYAALHRDRSGLDAYLAALESVPPAARAGFSRSERLAFWINAYNAYTIALVLDHWPVASIKDIGRFWESPFKLRFIPLPGPDGPLSLDAIEHERLRAELADPRIHAAIVCASASCPELRSEAYRASDVDRQLDEAMRRFLADPARNRWDAGRGQLELSAIFRWFREDFEAASGSVLGYVLRYLPAEAAAGVRAAGDPDVVHLDYDWSLNGR